jgi:hypothetical protein
MPKRLRDNPLNQHRTKTKRSYDNYLRPFFERTVNNDGSKIGTSVQSDPIKIQEESTDHVHQPSKTYGISADDFYIDSDADDDNDDCEDPF